MAMAMNTAPPNMDTAATATDPPPRWDAVPPALRLAWLASPALPIGAFSYSEGLESAVEHGLVRDEAGATQWLAQQLALMARGDLAAIAQGLAAWRADDTAALAALHDWLRCSRDGAESRLQSEQTGQSLAIWLRGWAAQDAPLAGRLALLRTLGAPPPFALVMALALASIPLPDEALLSGCAFGWAENQVQAALKAVPLGQSAGQRVLGHLAARVPAAVATALATPPAQRQLFAPMLSILAARHETQYSRLFRS